jgi:hypothetical protein
MSSVACYQRLHLDPPLQIPMPNGWPTVTFAETILDINIFFFATQSFSVQLTISDVWPHLGDHIRDAANPGQDDHLSRAIVNEQSITGDRRRPDQGDP